MLFGQNFSFAQSNINLAHSSFENGDFKSAAKYYQLELDSTAGNFELFYNLGTTYCKLGDLGQGRLYLEKAALIKPGSKATQKNIKWIKTELSEFIAPIPEFFLLSIWKRLAASLPFNIWYFFSLFSLCLAAFMLWQMLFSNKNGFKSKFFLPGFLIAIILFLLTYYLGQTRFNQLTARDYYVVVHEEATLKEKPEGETEIIQSLIPGTKVKTESKLGDWYKVTVEDGSKGWTKGKNLAEISL